MTMGSNNQVGSVKCPGCGTALTLDAGRASGEAVVCPVCDEQIVTPPAQEIRKQPQTLRMPLVQKLKVQSQTVSMPSVRKIEKQPQTLPAALRQTLIDFRLIGSIALAVLITFGLGYYFLIHQKERKTETQAAVIPEAPQPTPPAAPVSIPPLVPSTSAGNAPSASVIPASSVHAAESKPKDEPKKPEAAKAADAEESKPEKTEVSKNKEPAKSETKRDYAPVARPMAVAPSLEERAAFLGNWERITAMARSGKTISDEVLLERAGGPVWMDFSEIGKLKVDNPAVYLSVSDDKNQVDAYALTKGRERFDRAGAVITLRATRGNYTTDDKVCISKIDTKGLPEGVRIPGVGAIKEIVAGGKLFSADDTWSKIVVDLNAESPPSPPTVKLNGDNALVLYRLSPAEAAMVASGGLEVTVSGASASIAKTGGRTAVQSSEAESTLVFKCKSVESEAESIRSLLAAMSGKPQDAPQVRQTKSRHEVAPIREITPAGASSSSRADARKTAEADAKKLQAILGGVTVGVDWERCLDAVFGSSSYYGASHGGKVTLEEFDRRMNSAVKKKLEKTKLAVIRKAKVK